jgi:hypothetical protein
MRTLVFIAAILGTICVFGQDKKDSQKPYDVAAIDAANEKLRQRQSAAATQAVVRDNAENGISGPIDISGFDKKVRAIMEEGEDQRQDRLKWLRSEITSAGLVLQHVRQHDLPRAEKIEDVKEIESYIGNIKKEIIAIEYRYTYLPKLILKLDKGGRIYSEITIRQVFDEHNMLIDIGHSTVWVSGMLTAGMTTNGSATIDTVMRVSGTKTYASLDGGSNTVFLIEPVDLPPELEQVLKNSKNHEDGLYIEDPTK